MRNSLLLTLLLLAFAPARAVFAQECTSDDDCPEGLGCDLAPSGGFEIDCPPGEPCVQPEPEPRGGSCEPQEVVCTSDDDCPLGLTCTQQPEDEVACTAPPPGTPDPGGCEIPPPEPPQSVCTFEQPSCETDTDCDQEGFGCLESEGGTSCGGSGASCAPGAECPPPRRRVRRARSLSPMLS